jgi:hypothetical protein
VKPTDFRRPRTDRLLRVMFRNGEVSRQEYTAAQLRWTNTGSDWDVMAAEYADRQNDTAAWNPVSGGY